CPYTALFRSYQSDGRYEVSDFEGYISSQWKLKEGVTTAAEVVGTMRPGAMKLKDINGDGMISVADRGIIGNANPSHTGGFSLASRIYNFPDFSNASPKLRFPKFI